jgi:hypothetical protein
MVVVVSMYQSAWGSWGPKGEEGCLKKKQKQVQTIETVGTIPRHRNRRLEGSKESHWVTVPPPPLRNLSCCGDDGRGTVGKKPGALLEEEEETHS